MLTTTRTDGGKRQMDSVGPMLSEVLFDEGATVIESLVPLRSNVGAVDEAMRFAADPAGCVAIAGPTGWGKSHILHGTTGQIERLHGVSVPVFSAVDYVGSPCRHDPHILILDDAQEVIGRPRLRQQLKLLLERRVRAGKATMVAMTMARSSRSASSLLPLSRDWALHWIGVPNESERVLLLTKVSESMGLRMSAVLIRAIARHMHGDGRTLAGALKRLRLNGPDWLLPADTLRACGTLQPFFADNPHWDLRMTILKMGERNRALFPKAEIEDLCLFTMSKVAHLAEAEIAQTFGLEPGQVYVRAGRYQRRMEGDPVLRGYVDTLAELTARAISEPRRSPRP